MAVLKGGELLVELLRLIRDVPGEDTEFLRLRPRDEWHRQRPRGDRGPCSNVRRFIAILRAVKRCEG
jgi:hypothetical protein